MRLLLFEVNLCWKGHVGLRPQSTSVILPDPFIHKGKILVLIPRARRDKQGMLIDCICGHQRSVGFGYQLKFGKKEVNGLWYHPNVLLHLQSVPCLVHFTPI